MPRGDAATAWKWAGVTGPFKIGLGAERAGLHTRCNESPAIMRAKRVAGKRLPDQARRDLTRSRGPRSLTRQPEQGDLYSARRCRLGAQSRTDSAICAPTSARCATELLTLRSGHSWTRSPPPPDRDSRRSSRMPKTAEGTVTAWCACHVAMPRLQCLPARPSSLPFPASSLRSCPAGAARSCCLRAAAKIKA
jgi:hypothetical protein